MFKQGHTKRRAVALTLLVAFQVATSLFYPSTPVSAATVTTDTVDGQVQTYLLGNWLRMCFVQANLVIGSKDAMNQFRWFTSSGDRAIGHAATNSSTIGEANCTDTSQVQKAVAALGWSTSNPSEILCELGYSDCNGAGNPVISSPPSGITRDSYRIFGKYWGNTVQPTLNFAMRYWLYRKTFMLACQPEKVTAAGTGITAMKEVDPSGAITDVFYKYSVGANITTMVDGNLSDISQKCDQLAAAASQDANVQAFVTWVKANPAAAQAMMNAAPGGAGSTGSATETCNLAAIGWIVCPVARFLAGVTDSVYALVEKLLVFQPAANMLDTNNPIYKIWANIRNLANIAFVIAFFAVIYSQATSIGISNYGVKKMLPRLFVAAVLVNLSYYICVLGIDISNIVGASIDGVIKSVPLGSNAGVSYDYGNGSASGWLATITALLTGTGVAAVGIAAATGIGGALAAALPFLVTALFAVITALVILLARQAVLILLIIIAPLAFVAYVLPNTAKMFERWREAFTTLLIFYPLVAILFAGSTVAASVLRISASTGSGSDQLLKVMSLAIQMLPLFGLPFLLKFSGGILGRIAGMVNNPNKGPFDKLRKSAENKRDTVQDRARIRNLQKDDKNYTGKRFGRTRRRANAWLTASGYAKRSAIDEAEREGVAYEAKRAKTDFSSKQLSENAELAAKAAGGKRVLGKDTPDNAKRQTAIARTQAQALSKLNALRGEERKAGVQLLEEKELNNTQWVELQATGKTITDRGEEISGDFYQTAAMSRVIPTAQPNAIQKLFENSGPGRTTTSAAISYSVLQDSYNPIKSKVAIYNNPDLQTKLKNRETILDKDYQSAAGAELPKLTPDVFSGQADFVLGHALKGIKDNVITGTAQTEIIELATRSLADQNLQKNFSTKARERAIEIAQLGNPAYTPPTFSSQSNTASASSNNSSSGSTTTSPGGTSSTPSSSPGASSGAPASTPSPSTRPATTAQPQSSTWTNVGQAPAPDAGGTVTPDGTTLVVNRVSGSGAPSPTDFPSAPRAAARAASASPNPSTSSSTTPPQQPQPTPRTNRRAQAEQGTPRPSSPAAPRRDDVVEPSNGTFTQPIDDDAAPGNQEES